MISTITPPSLPALRRSALALLLALTTALPSLAVSPEAASLRDRGFAELENEQPDQAEITYRKLVDMVPGEPLAHANLAIALLRRQKYDEAMDSIANALDRAPDRPDLLAIRGEIRQWTGDLEGALKDLDRASQAAPDDLEILYATYSMATTLRTPESEPVADRVLARLAELRPENVVVILQLGQRAIARGDRSTAAGAFLRIEELLWQVQPMAFRALDMVKKALEGDDLSKARVPAVRLENVLKVSPMFRESLRELKTGIQGIPVQRFSKEPAATDFGPAGKVKLVGSPLSEAPGHAVVAGDFDADGRSDLVWLRADGSLDLLLAAKDRVPFLLPVVTAPKADPVDGESDKIAEDTAEPAETPENDGDPRLDRLATADIDNDGDLDLLAFGERHGRVWLNQGDATFVLAADHLGLGQAGARGVELIDFDIEGDLDVALVGGASGGADLYRNALDGPLQRVGEQALPQLPRSRAQSVFASDLDQDGDLDLLIGHVRGVQWLDNLRQGRFVDRSADAGLKPSRAVRRAVSADLDNDGYPDVVAAGDGVQAWRNRDGNFSPWTLSGVPEDGTFDTVDAVDLDNDGRRDLVLAGPTGLEAYGQATNGKFRAFSVDGPSATSWSSVATADLDDDGDLDLVVGGPGGLYRFENQGGEKNRWLRLRLRGLDKGSSKNNSFGVGSLVEVRSGQAYQLFEARGDELHIGLGNRQNADNVRVVWTNGVPQHRLDLEGNQMVVEEQLLKGSCPFLYAWDGEQYAFVTDLLWGAPLGLPAAPGVWVSSDPSEIVRVDGLKLKDGHYSLRLTEELWEAAFFDKARLWVVDHPSDVEVASSLRIIPGQATDETVYASRNLRPMAHVLDGEGLDVTEIVAERDEVYADGYGPSPYQGVAEPWTFTFDLGEAPIKPVRLHLDGWIFPSDASLNLAVAQRQDYPYLAPRLEVETADGWQVLMENMGFPPGKTKTMVVDLPPLPDGAHRLRMVTSLWLHWDRLAWTVDKADDAVRIVEHLEPASAELRYRGFSKLVRQAPNAPHAYDYSRTRLDSPWIPFAGSYTRFGDVRPLLDEVDDFSVILAPGDEIALEFDAGDLPATAEGWTRTLFLESHGWDKDADRNTWEGHRLEPLPFHAMSGYPYGDGESYPDTEAHRRYRSEWLTRTIAPRTQLEPTAAESTESP